MGRSSLCTGWGVKSAGEDTEPLKATWLCLTSNDVHDVVEIQIKAHFCKTTLLEHVVYAWSLMTQDNNVIQHVIQAAIKATITLINHLEAILAEHFWQCRPGKVMRVRRWVQESPMLLLPSGVQAINIARGDG